MGGKDNDTKLEQETQHWWSNIGGWERVSQVAELGGAPDTAHAWRGYLATYSGQATVLGTKGFSLRRGRLRRWETRGGFRKMRKIRHK